MTNRPRSVTIIGWIFIVFGSIALLYGLLPHGDITIAKRIAELRGHWFVHVSRIVMILAGVLLLRGFNWARCLLVAWLVFHVVIGALHSPVQMGIHTLFLAVIVYFLFRPVASAYFRGTQAERPEIPNGS